MKLIETSFKQTGEGYEHHITFEFENRSFVAIVEENVNESFIRDCYIIQENWFPIDIPKYFGAFKSDVYTFIYDSMQKGLPFGEDEEPEAPAEELG